MMRRSAWRPLVVSTATLSMVVTLTPSGPCLAGSNLQVFVTGPDFPAAGSSGAAPNYGATIEDKLGNVMETALSASPAGPVPSGTDVMFTAHVSGRPPAGVLGTVQLMDGADPIGGPTDVDASGNAAVTTSLTGAGDHAISAVFAGDHGFITGSASPSVVIVVQAGVADPTATSLTIAPTTATSADPVTLTAAVGDAVHHGTKPVGTIQFTDGGVRVGTTLAVAADGTVSYTHNVPAGSHAFGASFVPTDSGLFAPSSSTSQAYVVPSVAGAGPAVETSIDPGSLSISVATTSPVLLRTPTLNAAATYLTTSGSLHHITVTDTRAGSPGWVVSGQVTDFHNINGTINSVIPGVDLGWTPFVADEDAGQMVQPGVRVPPVTPALGYDAVSAGKAGLHASRQLAVAAPGAGTGTAHLGATLLLNVPTTVAPGTYDAVLTLTVI